MRVPLLVHDIFMHMYVYNGRAHEACGKQICDYMQLTALAEINIFRFIDFVFYI